MTSPNDPSADGVSRRIVLKKSLLASSTVAVGVSALSDAVAAHPPGCDVLVDPSDPHADASTIQGGVDTASPGDTVCVNDGTYTEQVVVDEDLTLTNSPGATPTIVAPSSPGQFTIPESGSTWEPVVFAFGGTETGGDVSGSSTVDVSISGFIIDGDGRQPADRSSGVLLRNVMGTSSDDARIKDNVVQDMGVGGKQTLGIFAYGDSDLIIRGNDVSEYERVGIGANGDGGVHPAPTVNIRENTVTGSTGIEVAWAPNGIQIGFGAEGQIKENEVNDNRWADDFGVTASGILVFESDQVDVKKNAVTNNDAGIAVGSWAWFLPSADGNKIIQNEITDVEGAGVFLEAAAIDGISMADPSVSNNKVTSNTIADATESNETDEGVLIDADDFSDDFDPVVENNKVIRNTITGFDNDVEIRNGVTDTKVQATEP